MFSEAFFVKKAGNREAFHNADRTLGNNVLFWWLCFNWVCGAFDLSWFAHFLLTFWKYQKGFSRVFFFVKILALCIVIIQKRSLIKNGIWWHTYGKVFIILHSCQKYDEDFFKFCGLLRKPKLYVKGVKTAKWMIENETLSSTWNWINIFNELNKSLHFFP